MSDNSHNQHHQDDTKKQQGEHYQNNDNNNCKIIKQTQQIPVKDFHDRNWNELKEIITQNRLGELGRKNKIQASLDQHMKFVNLEFKSIRDYIDHKVFCFPTEKINYKNDQGIEITRLVSKRPENLHQRLVFRPNDFPYSCDNSISHWILWCLKPIHFDDAKKLITKHTKKQHNDPDNDNNSFLFFINPVHLQSIKEISHYHVFIKNIDPNQIEFSI